MRWLKRILVVLVVLIIVYLLGPHPSTPIYNTDLPKVGSTVTEVEQYIKQIESLPNIKPNNQARIVWFNDSAKTPTNYSIVYLHGFSASQEEGNPIHTNTAKQFGCNLYLARLSKHGLSTTEELDSLTADNYWQSAKEALAIAKQLGNKVIIMGTSTGGSQALQLAATYPNLVAACVLISPNIAINDPNAWLLNNPWGLQIARLVKGGNYNVIENCKLPEYSKYWNCKYRLEAAVALEEMLETAMTKENFKKVTCPVLTLAYYKNEQEQDKVVKVSAMRTMMQQISSKQNKYIELPNTGNHVQGSPILSKDVESVQKEISAFLQEAIFNKQ